MTVEETTTLEKTQPHFTKHNISENYRKGRDKMLDSNPEEPDSPTSFAVSN